MTDQHPLTSIMDVAAHSLWNAGPQVARAHVAVHADGRVEVLGEKHGAAEVLRFTGSLLVVKVAGSNYWAARGEQRYSGAEVRVYAVHEVEVSEHRMLVKAVPLGDYDVRPKSGAEARARQALTLARQMFGP